MMKGSHHIIDETQWFACHGGEIKKEKINNIDQKISNHQDKRESELSPRNETYHLVQNWLGKKIP